MSELRICPELYQKIPSCYENSMTGANGFIGRHLLERLAGQHEFFALVRQVPTQTIPGVEYIAQDLGQPLNLKLACPANLMQSFIKLP